MPPGTVTASCSGLALTRIDFPAMLLVGEHDIVAPAAVRAAAALIPGGVFAEVPGAGHWLPRDAPEAVGAHLLELITLISQSRTS